LSSESWAGLNYGASKAARNIFSGVNGGIGGNWLVDLFSMAKWRSRWEGGVVDVVVACGLIIYVCLNVLFWVSWINLTI